MLRATWGGWPSTARWPTWCLRVDVVHPHTGYVLGLRTVVRRRAVDKGHTGVDVELEDAGEALRRMFWDFAFSAHVAAEGNASAVAASLATA